MDDKDKTVKVDAELQSNQLFHNDKYIGDKWEEARGGRRVLVVSVYPAYQHLFKEVEAMFGDRLSLRVKPDPSEEYK